MLDKKFLGLLELVVDSYIERWEPIGSKFLNALNYQWWAPSTLRKYLKVLEDEQYVYQPYHSAWRIPTLKWWWVYVQGVIDSVQGDDIDLARMQLRELVKALSQMVKGVVVGFVDWDDYHYLWIQNLLSNHSFVQDLQTLQQIVGRIESKKIIDILKKKNIKKGQINYSFFSLDDQEGEKIISVFSINLALEWGKNGVLAIVSPVRTNYKQNLRVLKKVLEVYGS